MKKSTSKYCTVKKISESEQIYLIPFFFCYGTRMATKNGEPNPIAYTRGRADLFRRCRLAATACHGPVDENVPTILSALDAGKFWLHPRNA